jgi:hypothetical protein
MVASMMPVPFYETLVRTGTNIVILPTFQACQVSAL